MKEEKAVVIDTASGLMWQQGGSSDFKTYDEAKEYIKKLNSSKYASFIDWRMPTLEEAMSLIEPTKMNGDLYIDPKFNAAQRRIWTSDQSQGESQAWFVDFYQGGCSWDYFYSSHYVRAVRSG